MQYHSKDFSVGIEVFKWMFFESGKGTSQMLMVSPGPIKNLETQFGKAFSEEAWKHLYRNRQISAGAFTTYLENTETKSEFTSGHVYLPYAGMHTIRQFVKDHRSLNTFFLPQSASDLAEYLQEYPGSREIMADLLLVPTTSLPSPVD